MSSDFWNSINQEQFHDLSMEEAGLAILRWWHGSDNRGRSVNAKNVGPPPQSPRSHETKRTFAEGWIWLQANALVAQDLGQLSSSEWFVLSRRGLELAESLDHEDPLARLALRWEQIHPSLQDHAYQAFVRGDFDGAAQRAFKQIEVRVRRLGKFDDTELGDVLMAKAFSEDNGPLTDTEAASAERRGMRNLFQGSYQVYRNPVAHRDNVLTSPAAGAEVMMLASHLMRVLDRIEMRIEVPQRCDG